MLQSRITVSSTVAKICQVCSLLCQNYLKPLVHETVGKPTGRRCTVDCVHVITSYDERSTYFNIGY